MERPVKEYRTYLFDLDNTVVDSRHGLEISLRAGFGEFGIPYDPARYDEYVATPLRETWDLHRPGDVCGFREFYAVVMGTYDRCYMDSVELFPDARECLEALAAAGKGLGIVSNSYAVHIEEILIRLDVRDVFGSLVGSDSCSHRKPDPQPVMLCLDELGAEPASAVMVGDSPNDVKAGRRAGTDTVFVDRGGWCPETGSDATVRDLRDLLVPFRR